MKSVTAIILQFSTWIAAAVAEVALHFLTAAPAWAQIAIFIAGTLISAIWSRMASFYNPDGTPAALPFRKE